MCIGDGQLEIATLNLQHHQSQAEGFCVPITLTGCSRMSEMNAKSAALSPNFGVRQIDGMQTGNHVREYLSDL